MSAAYRCDRCGKLQPGFSSCKASLVLDSGIFPDGPKYSFEYCLKCSYDAKAFFNNEVPNRVQ